MNASLIVGLLWSHVLLSAAQTPPKAKAKVLIVGVYHFQSKQNLYTQEQDAPLSSRRQQEISNAVERLKTFGPTKVALELAYHDPKANERYGKFLNANYSLGPNEAEQLGFRLARDLNLPRVYPNDRVLVLYGQGHVPLLRQFVADSPDLELVAADPYLSDATDH
jgi:hypothetical protein